MTIDALFNMFHMAYGVYYRNFEPIRSVEYPAPDLAAMVFLNKFRDGYYLISSSYNDEIFFNVDVEKMARELTEEDVIFLTRCGVEMSCYGTYYRVLIGV